MADIKVKKVFDKTIKTIDKVAVASEKMKDAVADIKDRESNNVSEYGTDKISDTTNRVVRTGVNKVNKYGKKSFEETKKNIGKAKVKIKDFKKKRLAKKKTSNKIKNTKNSIKTTKNVIKNTNKVTKESTKISKRMIEASKRTAKATIQSIKVATKVTIKTMKIIIAGTKALINAIIAGGWIAVIIILVICLVGALCTSVFGIFFSSEYKGDLTISSVISELNVDMNNKIIDIQNQNEHDEFVLDGSITSWKDMLLIYAVKVSNGKNEQEVVTMDNNKKNILKQIFWDMNSLSSEVKDEIVTEQGINTDGVPKQVQKKVLHIKITNKSVDEIKNQYMFTSTQIKQLEELSSSKYDSLWSSVIFGMRDSGEYVNWKQAGESWSNIRIGNTNHTIGEIGCLVTSIAILIEKSGINKNINPFNPGTFVEALNKNGGFDSGGNLQYSAINKVVPGFKYAGRVDLSNKSRSEKLSLITKYFNNGYYLTAEVKGATAGNQHWVAVVGVDANNVIMIDPGSNQTIMWNAYEYSKTSKFNYFQLTNH